MRAWFALGDRLDREQRYGDAMAAWRIGCEMMDSLVEWNEPQEEIDIEAELKKYATDIGGKKQNPGKSLQVTPIFIVGMPRSGSTLLEQVISAHPDVTAGGELTFLGECITEADGDGEKAGQNYLHMVQGIAAGKQFVTDKMPANFYHLGMIARHMPQAVILHTIRNPADTCLSCFSKLFNRGNLPWTYNLGSLERFYRRYVRVMDHWAAVCGDVYIDVRYEHMVTQPEALIRSVLAHIGLSDNEACYAPQNNAREVKTASKQQVKKPIYTSSIDRWKNYKEFERFAEFKIYKSVRELRGLPNTRALHS